MTALLLPHVKTVLVFSDTKNTSKSYAAQTHLFKRWIERHWNIWKCSLI